jgi:hypothetical protein
VDPENDQLIDIPSDDEVDQSTPPPEEKPEVKAEGKPPVKAEEKPEAKRRDDRVPLATFLEEKRKFTEALDSERAERAKLRAELEALKNPPKAPPKYDEDPKGFIEHATKSAAADVIAKLEETKAGVEEVKKSATETREQQNHQRFIEDLGQLEDVFVQQYDDYYAALAHVRNIAYHQIKEFSPELTDQQVFDAIGKQELAMAARAMQMGRNPHEAAYRLALINGYKKVEAKKEDKKPAKANGKAAPEVPDLEEDKKLAPDLTLGNSGGGGVDSDETPDPETFDPYEAAVQELFGRKRA